MEKEKDSLNRSDAVHLKMRETELRDEIAVTGRNLQDKEGFLQTKQEQYQDVRNRQKEEEDRQYHRKKEISEILEEMQSEADDMAFEEHSFFKEELLALQLRLAVFRRCFQLSEMFILPLKL